MSDAGLYEPDYDEWDRRSVEVAIHNEEHNQMTDTNAPTLRELLRGDGGQYPNGRYVWYRIAHESVERVEAILLAPLQAEIDRLRTQIEQDNAVINTLMADASVYASEISQIRSKVATADVLRDVAEEAKKYIGAMPTFFGRIHNAVKAYDAVPVAASNLTGIPEEAMPAVARNYGHIDYYGPLCGPITFASDTAPPAVEDAGETGEEHVRDADWPMDVVTVNDRLDYLCAIADQQSTDHNAHVIATAEHLAALRRDVTQLEAFAAGSIEPTAALRRDVDALNNTIGERSNNLDRVFNSFMARLEFLESRERPEPGGVRDVGAVAALNAWHGVSEYNYSKRQIEQMREAINIALAAEAGR